VHNHFLQKTVYNGIVLPAAYGALYGASLFHRKLKETFATRRNIRSRWRTSGVCFDERPVWFHVSSVGEYEQAKPVISKLRENFPEVPVALTFTSPSGFKYASKKERLGDGNNIKFMEYLPIDFTRNVRFCLAFLNPRLLVFVKFDLWPNLVWETASMGIPSLLIDATLSESSYRFRLGRPFYRAVYADLKRILAISERDAARFNLCVPEHSGIQVTGDTRFDRVMERKRLTIRPSLELDKEGRFVVIAGSTWPKDEIHLLPALSRLFERVSGLLLIIAPHEPSEERVGGLLQWARAQGLEAARLSMHQSLAQHNHRQQVLIVDSVGVLAETYQYADVAYIGGSFSTGVHSVIEPAIMGIPVLFGPHHKNSFEALELLRHRSSFEVGDCEAIYDGLASLHANRDLRMSMGDRAKVYVESQLGATDRCMENLAEYI